ncbi:MAG: imidazole glycerol phosphate synthase subunit HisH, partial [Dehalococcoidia bacterium]
MRLAIIDYGAGNLRNVARAVACLGYEGVITSSPRDVLAADAVILPGAGATADTVRSLRQLELDGAIARFIASGRPFMGVCVGLQVLFEASEEGGLHDCLGILPGRVRRLPDGPKVPHIGWNRVHQTQEHPIFSGVAEGDFFYFVHSYYADVQDPTLVVADTEYGVAFP